MSRGGARLNSGRKPKWFHSETTTIRVPKAFVEQILAFARQVDRNEKPCHASISDSVAKSKPDIEKVAKSITPAERVLDLRGISVSRLEGRTLVFLSDLIKAGYKIEPDVLSNVIQMENR